MVRSLMFFGSASVHSAELLDSWVRPLCDRHGVWLRIAPTGSHRGTALVGGAVSSLVLWDCSLDGPDDVYRALTVRAKLSPKHLLVSRTPMPRNVLARRQCAPIHGHTLDNAAIGQWLDRELHHQFTGDPPASAHTGIDQLARHYWMFDTPADYFLSFRGTHQDEAQRWSAEFARTHRTTVRMVPPNEYSYPTEVITRQQAWEGAARLLHEMTATSNVIIHHTPDYFDSFWTATEFLTTLILLGRDPRTRQSRLRSAHFTSPGSEPTLRSFRDGLLATGVRTLRGDEADQFVFLINNSDPFTSAPETTAPPRGLARPLAWTVRRWGYYRPEFQDRAFWDQVWIPCQHCAPNHRAPESVDWTAHLQHPTPTTSSDYFGYFPAERSTLASGSVRCPTCHTNATLANRRGTRALWSPIQTTEPDQDRPVIATQPIWEVIPT